MAGIIEKDGLVLLAQRKAGGHFGGLWEFPGGKLEPSESPQECLKRELREEFNIETQVHEFVGENTFASNSFHISLAAYRVTITSGTMKLNDHDQIQWVAPESLLQFSLAPPDIPIAEAHLNQCRTLAFYNQNAANYIQETRSLSVNREISRFIGLLPEGGSILDLGCGSGRDTLYFLSQGLNVYSVDGSAEIAAQTSQAIKHPVQVLSFTELAFEQVFDGIWACASLLHCHRTQMERVMDNIFTALQENGILYASFKWGNCESLDDRGRHFNNQTPQSLEQLLENQPKAEIMEIWENESHLRGTAQRWVNLLARKRNS